MAVTISAQPEVIPELTKEELEIIEHLELLENLDFLDEDIELLANLEEIGEEND